MMTVCLPFAPTRKHIQERAGRQRLFFFFSIFFFLSPAWLKEKKKWRIKKQNTKYKHAVKNILALRRRRRREMGQLSTVQEDNKRNK